MQPCRSWLIYTLKGESGERSSPPTGQSVDPRSWRRRAEVSMAPGRPCTAADHHAAPARLKAPITPCPFGLSAPLELSRSRPISACSGRRMTRVLSKAAKLGWTSTLRRLLFHVMTCNRSRLERLARLIIGSTCLLATAPNWMATRLQGDHFPVSFVSPSQLKTSMPLETRRSRHSLHHCS